MKKKTQAGTSFYLQFEFDQKRNQEVLLLRNLQNLENLENLEDLEDQEDREDRGDREDREDREDRGGEENQLKYENNNQEQNSLVLL
ncbi:hypothetical protein F2P81_022920 [Scophthalmus maximus]|uniref:Uncharacterized protein n=1 Tax=Scophthalmus maximus TaxID=52904 RepID=A0A6A4RVW7_SCOMX|nr:hypothetical protein F2P81_022920 [Scophthalmus maximus]